MLTKIMLASLGHNELTTESYKDLMIWYFNDLHVKMGSQDMYK